MKRETTARHAYLDVSEKDENQFPVRFVFINIIKRTRARAHTHTHTIAVNASTHTHRITQTKDTKTNEHEEEFITYQ